VVKSTSTWVALPVRCTISPICLIAEPGQDYRRALCRQSPRHCCGAKCQRLSQLQVHTSRNMKSLQIANGKEWLQKLFFCGVFPCQQLTLVSACTALVLKETHETGL
jgi:hypothetical protein